MGSGQTWKMHLSEKGARAGPVQNSTVEMRRGGRPGLEGDYFVVKARELGTRREQGGILAYCG